MCEHCQPPTRRQFLLGTAAASAALLAACATLPQNDLPDAYENHVSDEFGGQVSIDPKKIIPQPPQPPRPSDFGSIMARSAWTATPLQLRIPPANPMGAVTKLTIHHSGDGKMFAPKTVADVARHLQIVREAHLQRGMIDIGYHFAVDPLGRAWQLRSLAYEGQHVRMSATGFRNNEHNVGVVALGDFTIQSVTTAQSNRLVELVRSIRGKYALKPADVFMHGEIVQTDCPGRWLKAAILDARKRNLV